MHNGSLAVQDCAPKKRVLEKSRRITFGVDDEALDWALPQLPVDHVIELLQFGKFMHHLQHRRTPRIPLYELAGREGFETIAKQRDSIWNGPSTWTKGWPAAILSSISKRIKFSADMKEASGPFKDSC